MARIRTLKPEFWDSPSTAQADLAVRLTFMAMWNWADDSGHGTANLKELEAFCWPHDDVRNLPRSVGRGISGDRRGNSAAVWRNFAEICGEVAEVYGVVFYRVAGRPYYEITNFKRHQSKDYRPQSRYPLPDEGEIYDVTSGNGQTLGSRQEPTCGTSGDRRGNSAAPAGISGPGTGEQGNRGTGEQGLPHVPEIVTGSAPATSGNEAQQIVNEWQKASGVPMSDSTKTGMRLAINQSLRAGHDAETIGVGLADWANSKMTNPNQIAGFVDRAAVRPNLAATRHDHNADGWNNLDTRGA